MKKSSLTCWVLQQTYVHHTFAYGCNNIQSPSLRCVIHCGDRVRWLPPVVSGTHLHSGASQQRVVVLPKSRGAGRRTEEAHKTEKCEEYWAAQKITKPVCFRLFLCSFSQRLFHFNFMYLLTSGLNSVMYDCQLLLCELNKQKTLERWGCRTNIVRLFFNHCLC